MRSILCAIAMLLVSATAAHSAMWGPTWSEISGSQYHKTIMDRRAAIIKSVDGRSYTDRIVKIEPGRHAIIVQSIKRKGFRGSDVTMELDIAPCKRYYLNAQFASSVGPEWEPVIDYVEDIAGCKVDDPRR
jgi:hypothetical protein